MPGTLIAAGETDKGARPDNQDAILLHVPYFAVADGAGGHADGALAAETAVGALNEFIAERELDDLDVVEAVTAAHWAVHTGAGAALGFARMATTLTFGVVRAVDGNLMVDIGHVGDSRGYLISDGEIIQLTRDHSVVADLVERGQLDIEDVPRHPLRNALTRCLGQLEPLQVDRITRQLGHGDLVLLASDGLNKHLPDADILRIVNSAAAPQEAAAELVAETNRRGGSDNVSVVCVKVDGEPAATRFDQSAAVRGKRDTAELLIVPDQAAAPDRHHHWWRR